jgi:hypothetical protein
MSSTKRPVQELFPLMYDEPRRVAGRYLGRERSNHTLQPTGRLPHVELGVLCRKSVDGLIGRTAQIASTP